MSISLEQLPANVLRALSWWAGNYDKPLINIYKTKPELLEDLPKGTDGFLYRGLSITKALHNKLLQGEIIKNKSVLESWSVDIKNAKNFATHGDKPVGLVVKKYIPTNMRILHTNLLKYSKKYKPTIVVRMLVNEFLNMQHEKEVICLSQNIDIKDVIETYR